MADRTEQYRKTIDDFAAAAVDAIDSGEFGAITIISSPSDRPWSAGDVKGWASPELREKYDTPQILLTAVLSLVRVLLGKEGVPPDVLHQLVMRVAMDLGVAAVIVVDVEGNAVFDGTDDDDIPQA
jgi:hypothetical protein